MIHKFLLGIAFVAVLLGVAGAADAKSLVIIFSRADENYNVGYVQEGNTMVLAKMIAEKTGSDLFEIRTVKPYPKDYDTAIDIAKKEQNAHARPAIAEDKNIDEYDTIFFGYPIWWGDLPMACYTFLEAHDFTGKKIALFCTHEGSGLSNTDSKLRRAAPGAEILRGLVVRGSVAQNSRAEAEKSVNSWLAKLGY